MRNADVQDIKAQIQQHEERIIEANESIIWNQKQIEILSEMVSSWEKENGDAGPPERKPSTCPYSD